MNLRETEEFLRIGTPGTLKEETLYKFMDFPNKLLDRSMIHWESLIDEDVIASFTPYLPAARRLYLVRKHFDPKMIEEALRFIQDGIELKGGSARLVRFGQETIEEIQRAILVYEANKQRLEMGEKLPEQKLSVFSSEARGKLIRIGEGFAPIPDPNSHVAISSIIEGAALPKLTLNQIRNVRKNIIVVNTIAGTNLVLPEA